MIGWVVGFSLGETFSLRIIWERDEMPWISGCHTSFGFSALDMLPLGVCFSHLGLLAMGSDVLCWFGIGPPGYGLDGHWY